WPWFLPISPPKTVRSIEYYEQAVGRKASPLPGENRSEKTIYIPDENTGRQKLEDQSMNVIGHNELLTGKFFEDFAKQGGPLSLVLNLLPGMNATGGLHDFWLNPGNPNKLDKGFINNYGTMLPAAMISIAEIVGNYTRGCEAQILTYYFNERERRRRFYD
ncbi:hypothetical protein MO867_22230, partial [Microbulbifer sp. OS29]